MMSQRSDQPSAARPSDHEKVVPSNKVKSLFQNSFTQEELCVPIDDDETNSISRKNSEAF